MAGDGVAMGGYLSPEASAADPRLALLAGKWISITSIIVGALSSATLMSTFIMDRVLGMGGETDLVAINTSLLFFLTPLSCTSVIIGVLGAFLHRRRWLGLAG